LCRYSDWQRHCEGGHPWLWALMGKSASKTLLLILLGLEGVLWNDYSYIEDQWPGRVKVVTLRMVHDRITAEWLGS